MTGIVLVCPEGVRLAT